MLRFSPLSGLRAGLVALALVCPPLLGAQTAMTPSVSELTTLSSPATARPTPADGQRASSGPVFGAASVGVHVPDASSARSASAAPDQHMGAGRNVALMGVGAAALITGLVIGGSGGTILAIGGGVIGLVGLYHYLQ